MSKIVQPVSNPVASNPAGSLPANDNTRVLIIHGALDGIVLTDPRGRVVYGPTTASIAARKRAEMLEAVS